MAQQKRFIAGAVCPACKQQDKTVVYVVDMGSVRECVSCGHRESLDDLGNQKELPTRVSGKDNDKDIVEAVQIIDPKALH